HAADTRKAVAAVGQQSIYQGSISMPRAGVHDEPGRLVDDDQVLVLIDDIERNAFRLRLGRLRRRHLDPEHLVRFDPVSGLAYRPARSRDVAGTEQRLNPGAAHRRELSRQKAIETHLALLGGDDALDRLRTNGIGHHEYRLSF